MPYFVICPIYAVLVVGGLILGLGLLCFARLRRYAGFILCGTAGTFPGFLIGNLLFWVAFIGLALLLKIPVDRFGDSDFIKVIGGWFLIVVMIGGLAIANILGCGLGFLFGCWLFAKNKKRSAKKSDPAPTAASLNETDIPPLL